MNSAYLAAGLAWMRERLGAGGGDPDAARWWEAGAAGGAAPRRSSCWATGSACPGSSGSCCCSRRRRSSTRASPPAAPQANGNPPAAYPTLALALAVLPGAAWDVVSPQRPLRYWRLIELDEPRAEPLTATRMRIDERIVSFIKGLNVMDDRLAPFVTPVARASAEPAGQP